MLIDVKAKENDVHLVQVLEDNDAFAAVLEFNRVVLEGISLFHAWADVKGAAHGGDLSDVNLTASLRCQFRRFLQGNILIVQK